MDFQTNQPDVYPGMDSQVDTASDFKKIADETINRNKLDAARQPYDELRRLGFGADEIGAAWARRQAEAKDAGCEDKFMPQLRKWLLDTSVKGCQKMVEAARQRAGRGEKHLRRAPDGAWLIIGDGPVHPFVDANGIVYRGDNKETSLTRTLLRPFARSDSRAGASSPSDCSRACGQIPRAATCASWTSSSRVRPTAGSAARP